MNDKMHHETREVIDVIYCFERLNTLSFLEEIFDFWIEFEFSGMNLMFFEINWKEFEFYWKESFWKEFELFEKSLSFLERM